MIFCQNNNLTKEEKCKYESDEHYRCRNFFGVIDQCKEKVELVTENGDRYKLFWSILFVTLLANKIQVFYAGIPLRSGYFLLFGSEA